VIKYIYPRTSTHSQRLCIDSLTPLLFLSFSYHGSMSIFTSSADQPFLVVSKDTFISSLTQPSDDELDAIVARATGIIEDWIESCSLVLSDFEGKRYTDCFATGGFATITAGQIICLNTFKHVSTVA
jgi:hypothetical protein